MHEEMVLKPTTPANEHKNILPSKASVASAIFFSPVFQLYIYDHLQLPFAHENVTIYLQFKTNGSFPRQGSGGAS